MGNDHSLFPIPISYNARRRALPGAALCAQAGERVSMLYNLDMSRRTVITRIRRRRAHLEKLGVKSLSLFGSVARGEERPDSDVDILVEFKGRATFDRYMDTKFYLEELLGCKVDLVTPKAIKPRMKSYIMQELVHVT